MRIRRVKEVRQPDQRGGTRCAMLGCAALDFAALGCAALDFAVLGFALGVACAALDDAPFPPVLAIRAAFPSLARAPHAQPSSARFDHIWMGWTRGRSCAPCVRNCTMRGGRRDTSEESGCGPSHETPEEACSRAVLQQPEARGRHDRLEARVHIELLDDADDVVARGDGADIERGGDLGVGHAHGEEAQHLALAPC